MTVPTMTELDEWADTLRKEFTTLKQYWNRYEQEIDEIIKRGDEARNELFARDGKGRAASVSGFRLSRDDMFGIWNDLEKRLATFTLEREKQTARIITALQEVETLSLIHI